MTKKKAPAPPVPPPPPPPPAPKSSTERGKDRKDRLRAMGMKEVRNLWAYPEVEEFIRVTTTSLNMTHESKAAALASAKTAVPKKGRK